MNFLHQNKLQKISASFLLALMLFINAVKTFHTHDFSYSKTGKANANSTSVKSLFSCAICDFQFAKDSDAQVTSLDIITPLNFIAVYYGYKLSASYSFSDEFSVRGPPAILS